MFQNGPQQSDGTPANSLYAFFTDLIRQYEKDQKIAKGTTSNVSTLHALKEVLNGYQIFELITDKQNRNKDINTLLRVVEFATTDYDVAVGMGKAMSLTEMCAAHWRQIIEMDDSKIQRKYAKMLSGYRERLSIYVTNSEEGYATSDTESTLPESIVPSDDEISVTDSIFESDSIKRSKKVDPKALVGDFKNKLSPVSTLLGRWEATYALLLVLRDILGRTEPETVIEPDPAESILATDDSKAICSFCNREIIFAWQLSDGRCMCAHCHDHQKTQKDEIKRLFLETKQMLESHYHIEFRKDINVRFQSADAIRKAAGGLDNGRIVGFYSHDKRQLWIEARGPSVAMESTIIHELTHAWQHDVLPLKELANAFPKDVRDKRVQLLLEGHAVYVELEAMTEKRPRTQPRQLRCSDYMGNSAARHGTRGRSSGLGGFSEESPHSVHQDQR